MLGLITPVSTESASMERLLEYSLLPATQTCFEMQVSFPIVEVGDFKPGCRASKCIERFIDGGKLFFWRLWIDEQDSGVPEWDTPFVYLR
jgi:hypothetical protein